MRKWIVLSAVSFVLTGTAIVTTQTSYALADDHGRLHAQGQDHKDKNKENAEHISSYQEHTNKPYDNAQQVITQFEQTIDEYQKALSSMAPQTSDKPTIKAHNTAHKTTVPSHKPFTNTTATSSQNTTTAAQPADTHRSNTHVQQSSQSQTKTPTNEPKQSAGTTTRVSQTQPLQQIQVHVSPLTLALQSYHTATGADDAAQQAFQDAVQQYFSAQQNALNGHTATAAECIPDVRQALTNLENALQNQDEVSQLISSLQTDAKQGNDSKLVSTLHRMSQLEETKASELNDASAVLTAAAQKIDNAVN